MKRIVPIFGVVIASVAVAGLVTYWTGSRPRTEVEPDGPFTPSQQPGAVVAAPAYRLSGPYTHENLSVFLIHGPETLEGLSFLTLQDGLEQKRAVMHETGSVSALSVENLSGDAELFIQSGDIVKGGKQDRTLPYDALIGPQSGQVPINSFCVEQGRWTKRGKESSEYFSESSSNLATGSLKRAAAAPGEASQAAVWSNVSKTQERLAGKLGSDVQAGASRSSLQLTMESPAVKAAMHPFQSALGPVPDAHADAIGCVVTVNGRVISADVYAARSLFKKLWAKLLAAGAMEAFLEAAPGVPADRASEEVVRAFLTEAEGGQPASEAVTERTYVHVRRTERVLLVESCDRSRENLVLHRCFLTRASESR